MSDATKKTTQASNSKEQFITFTSIAVPVRSALTGKPISVDWNVAK